MSLTNKNKEQISEVLAQTPYLADVLNSQNQINPFHIGDKNQFGIDSPSGSLLNWPLSPPYNPYNPPQPPYNPNLLTPPTFIVSAPTVVEPSFKRKDLGYILKIPLLGYKRENITAKVVNANLALIASCGGLEGNEAVSYSIKIPKDADMQLDSVLLNGILTITAAILPLEETTITIR